MQRTSNTGENIKQTVIVGANAKNPEVVLVKAFFKDSTVRADKRTDGTVDVLVGDKYGGFNKKAQDRHRGEGRDRLPAVDPDGHPGARELSS